MVTRIKVDCFPIIKNKWRDRIPVRTGMSSGPIVNSMHDIFTKKRLSDGSFFTTVLVLVVVNR